MSFILDALRKSENERQKQSAPGLADAQYTVARQRRSVWLPLLVVILGINAVVVAALFLRDDASGKPNANTPTVAQGDVTRPRSDRVAERAPKPADASPLYREIAPRRDPTPARAATIATEPGPTSATSAAPTARPSSDDAALPSLARLAADGAVALPELHVDIHVFAGEPDKRFVFINMKKYREGETLKEGPTLETITETGAILAYQGNRFTIERE